MSFPTFKQSILPMTYNMEQVNADGYRYYRCDGGNYPSITTVLGCHPSGEWVNEWVKNVGVERAERIRNRAARLGSAVHDLAERYLGNTLTQRDIMKALPDVKLRFKSLRKFLDGVSEVFLLERGVYSDILGLAGTIDFFGVYNGEITAVDFKTASGIRTEEEIQGYFAQVTFYAMAILERYPAFITKMPNIAIVIAVDGVDEPQIFLKSGKDFIRNSLTYVKECDIIYTTMNPDRILT